MMDGWERARALAEKHAQAGGLFIRLVNDGDHVIGAFCGEPLAREVAWIGGRAEDYDPQNPAHVKEGASLRVMINFFVPGEGKMRIIEGGTQWFKDVCAVRDKYGTRDWLFEIKRHGKPKDPKTRYGILPETKIDDDLRARIAAADLHDLASIGSAHGEEEPEPGEPAAPKAAGRAAAPATTTTASADAASGPGLIDTNVAVEIVGRLKTLPRADVDVFLQRFAMTRVRELKASDEKAARQFLDELARKYGPVQDQAEQDPFA